MHVGLSIVRNLGLQLTSIELVILIWVTNACFFLLDPHFLDNFFNCGFLGFLFPELPNSLVFVIFCFFSVMFRIFEGVVAV